MPLGYYFLWILPKNLFSRLCGWFANLHLPPWILQPLLRLFVRVFQVDMKHAIEPLENYPTFNAFFTRRLQAMARPITSPPHHLISPVDGTIGQFGTIEHGTLIQAKGQNYLLSQLLGDSNKALQYEEGTYLTIYLAPYNYHRIHSMVKGTINRFSYIPGQLWTVSPLGVNHVPKLFAINERLISYIFTSGGECALVKVGATVVGKIKVEYHAIESNCFGAKRCDFTLAKSYPLERGTEIGRFELGSTVICIFQKGQVQLNNLSLGQSVQYGESIGLFNYHHGETL